VIIAVVVLLGLRRVAVAAVAAAAAGFWLVAVRHGCPEPLWVLAAAAPPLEAVALIAGPGLPSPRCLLRWREGIVLLLAAAALQVLTLASDASSPDVGTGALVKATAHSASWDHMRYPSVWGYVTATLVLAVAAAGLALTLRVGRYFLLLVALCYPIVAELAALVGHRDDLMGIPTPGHLAVLYLPPLLVLAGIMIATRLRLRPQVVPGTPESA